LKEAPLSLIIEREGLPLISMEMGKFIVLLHVVTSSSEKIVFICHHIISDMIFVVKRCIISA